MGSQTLEILRQGVWASLTGGWFYDPHQGVFCNVVHLYLWLFLLCSPFVAYLYFPSTWLTWCIYCILTSLTIFLVKLTNMVLHRLYDRAQTMSEANLKNPLFKIIKETEPREDETGIEMKVMGNDGSRNSVEQAINEASEENSMMSMENVNSIIDLKVDVHRKNSSESIELMFYAPSLISGNSQQDQQSLAGSASVTKSIRSATNAAATGEPNAKYLTVYPENEIELSKASTSSAAAAAHATSSAAFATSRQPHLLRKSSEEFKRRHQRRRLERQSSLDAAAESAIVTKLMRNQSDTIATMPGSSGAARNETFLHPQTAAAATFSGGFGKLSSPSAKAALPPTTTSNIPTTTASSSATNVAHRSSTTSGGDTTTFPTAAVAAAAAAATRNSRLQRHRSSETHDERVKQQNRGIFLPIHHEQHHHHHHGASSSGALAAIGNSILDADELEMALGGSAGGVDNRVRALQSWILGSSSDVYIEDDSYTKSDFGIEQLDGRSSMGANRASFLLQQQQQLNSHYQHQQQYRSQTHNGGQLPHQLHQPHHARHHHHGAANIRKDSTSTMSALQLPVAAPPLTATTKGGSGGMKRRHSNATALFKSVGGGGGSGVSGNTQQHSATGGTSGGGQQPTVRRIKSTALEISCPRPSISNLCPHPNSVEAINGQQQIKNPQSALLPPPSKCLVRNPHLNLCPKFGGSFGGSGSSLNFGGGGSSGGGASTSGSTTALIEPVYPIVEHADEKTSLDTGGDLEIADIDEDVADDSVAADVDDDEVDDVPLRRRHKALGYQHHSAESDVGDILADDNDAFKDFDDNLEHILNDLQHTHNQLDDLKASYAAAEHRKVHVYRKMPHYNHQQSAIGDFEIDGVAAQREHTAATTADDDDEGPSTSQALRQRFHSTDSEPENNGSRSPLLSTKWLWESSDAVSKAADKAMRTEIAAVQQKHKNFPQQLLYEGRTNSLKGEGDSGCPSSDCEQVSASSKDMLLAGMDTSTPDNSMAGKQEHNRDTEGMKDVEAAAADGPKKTENYSGTSRNLGAIPKVVKYREIDEVPQALGSASASSQLHKRRGNNNSVERSIMAANHSSTSKATSRTSSSNSSRSISADSFSADIHKMLWLMHGGEVDERGRPITGVGPDGAPITATSTVVPPNMSSAHFQFYQDAIRALNTYPPGNSSDGLSLSERIYFRDKMRRSSKQISEPGNSSIGDYSSQAHELQSTQLSGNSQCRTSHPAIGVVVGSSLNARNVSNAATLSIQGLINVINDERNLSQGGRAGGGGATAAAGGSVDGTLPACMMNFEQNLENYCDYWRPPAMLSTEKRIAPKSFYKYRIKWCGYEHEFKISMDRLELLALFDRDLHWLHIVLSVALCALVAYLGATILQHGYYKDLFAFLFCAVIAGSQYSLVKSVQPDAASPIHGFNKTVAYSRAIYFSLCGGLLLLLEQMKRDYEQAETPVEDLVFFGIHYSPTVLTTAMLGIMYVVLLCFPLIFSLGLFPQVNTFLMYLLEQIDMHVFGGNAAGSLLGSFLCVLRSIVGVMLLYGPLYAALAEGRGTQFILFSIFCAMLIPLGYHLSRSASDFSHVWALVKNCIVSTYRDDDDELSAASGSAASGGGGGSCQKVVSSTPKRGKHSRVSAEKSRISNTASNENIEMSSLDKLPTTVTTNNEREDEHTNLERKSSKSKASSLGSSSQTLGKTLSSSKKAITASNSFASMAATAAGATGGAEGGSDVHNEANNDVNEGAAASVSGGVNAEVSMNANIANDGEDGDADGEDNDEDLDDDKVSTSSTTNPGDMSTLTAGGGGADNGLSENDTESPDPLPKKLQNTVNTRLKNDIVVTTLLAVVVLGLHCSTVFTVLQPDLNIVLYAFTGALGLLLHYIIPQMRKHMPWLCFSRPILRQKEFGQFEVSNAPKVMWFEKVYIYLCMAERNVMFPLLVISALTADSQVIANKFGIAWGTLIVAVCALKFIRNAYSDPTNQYLIVMFTVLFFRVDFAIASETFLIDYFFVSLAYRKCCDFLLKLQFIVTYIAPWQITWGSAFHAFAQPFSVPHSAMLFLQAAVSAVLSTPLNPFLGSAIFLTSYVRPIKFWERDYNTRRIDHSNTRLSSQLERDLGADDNNLNSIFYEHLTRSLQHSLCGDLLMGRWGNVNQGDCFVLASDYLNCLVHIIELGNGLCTFQMRGLEFRGTYCQQREVEAITEDVEDNDGCCCCDPGHLPRLLSMNAMFSTRWLAWQVVAAQYVLEGYSISDNLASATLQVFEYRKVLITYYIKSIIYYVIKNPKLDQWLASGPIQDALQHTLSRQFADLDPIFNINLDEDFDFRAVGITRASFCYIYLSWINYCYDMRKEGQNPAAAGAPPAPAASSAYNDSKSTPNLSTAQTKSQSQQQLRARPQKSATMSGSATVNSTEHIAISQSFASISRQTSESAPGLSGAGLSLGYASGVAHVPLDNSLNNSSTATVEAVRQVLSGQLRTSKTPPTKPLRKEDSHSPSAPGGRAASEETARERPTIKLKVPSIAKDSPIVSLCLALGLLARRSLATASHSSLTGVEFFLHGLHALFKGDFRITSARDEWVFADMELLHSVVAPAVKMALKLQQDHISNPDEFLVPKALYDAIDTCSKDLVISHEADPVWRSAVLRGAPNLLALRHVMEDGSDEYRIIRLTKRFLSFRVIKLNRECVRGLWAGQQQELIYLRNRNPERGSIQNAKQALRNIINSSCDQPIGYPIYVSPLTTSYADTNEQLRDVIGGAITLDSIKSNVLDWWHRIRERCRQGCSSGSAMEASNIVLGGGSSGGGGLGPACSAGGESGEIAPGYISAPIYNTLTVSNFFGLRSGNGPSMGGSLGAQYGSDGIAAMRSGLAVLPVKPTSTTLLAGLINRERELERDREMRESRSIRKSQTQTPSGVGMRADRERRATLPIASTSMGVVSGGSAPAKGGADSTQMADKDPNDMQTSSSPRYTKISCSSGSLGIGNIITAPGDYPRKTKGAICLTAAAAGIGNDSGKLSGDLLTPRKPRIDLYKKVIIVDDAEIYDCLDLGRRIDVTWPNERMRSNGGRVGWKDWIPRAGMVGYVVHYWIPNHVDPRFQSHVNRIVYLIEIGERFVPVGEYGLREYNQIIDTSSEEIALGAYMSSRRSSLQQELDELRHQQREGLTPILGSSLESPTSQLAASTTNEPPIRMLSTLSSSGVAKLKIKAVSSSSSSEDEISLTNYEIQRCELLMNMWKLIAERKQAAADTSHSHSPGVEDYDNGAEETTPTTVEEQASSEAEKLETPTEAEMEKKDVEADGKREEEEPQETIEQDGAERSEAEMDEQEALEGIPTVVLTLTASSDDDEGDERIEELSTPVASTTVESAESAEIAETTGKEEANATEV